MPVRPLTPAIYDPRLLTTHRSSNPAGSRLRDPQILHLHPGPPNSHPHAKGRQGAARLGLGYWQADDKGGQGVETGYQSGEEQET